MAETHYILTINPGSTSTKIGIFKNSELLFEDKLQHSSEEINSFASIPDQYEFRKKIIEKSLEKRGFEKGRLSAIVARGGALKPVPSGTFLINDKMVDDLINRPLTQHISNLAAIIGFEMAKELKINSYIVDPICVDEFEPVARISGFPEITRRSLVHALNIRSVARAAAKFFNKNINEMNLIMVHLGGGFSICPMQKGKIIDVNNANEAGPMAAERSGTVPASSLVKLCFSGRFNQKEMLEKITKKGGMVAHIGINDLVEAEKRIKDGDEKAKLVVDAMAYQISKEIGAMATVLKGKVDKIVITGGMAHSKYLINIIEERVSFIAQLALYPGENELKALNEGGLRILNNLEKAMDYK